VIIRELPAEEWGKLEGHPALGGQSLPDPTYHKIVVAEDGDRIVGAWFMMQVIHLEPVWIDPLYRGGTLPLRLLSTMSSILDSCSVKQAFCFADRPEIAGYLQRLGMHKLPYETFMYEVPSCPRQ